MEAMKSYSHAAHGREKLSGVKTAMSPVLMGVPFFRHFAAVSLWHIFSNIVVALHFDLRTFRSTPSGLIAWMGTGVL